MIANLRIWLALSIDKRAVTALEYGLITALIAAAIVGAVSSLGTNIQSTFLYIAGNL
ncbi:MAG: Flp family type IVb pilin [Acidisphaera sp.]|nr:Flp family type IVb pilin [Acidisphaera sp.]